MCVFVNRKIHVVNVVDIERPSGLRLDPFAHIRYTIINYPPLQLEPFFAKPVYGIQQTFHQHIYKFVCMYVCVHYGQPINLYVVHRYPPPYFFIVKFLFF